MSNKYIVANKEEVVADINQLSYIGTLERTIEDTLSVFGFCLTANNDMHRFITTAKTLEDLFDLERFKKCCRMWKDFKYQAFILTKDGDLINVLTCLSEDGIVTVFEKIDRCKDWRFYVEPSADSFSTSSIEMISQLEAINCEIKAGSSFKEAMLLASMVLIRPIRNFVSFTSSTIEAHRSTFTVDLHYPTGVNP